jgi:hypothetical protein
VASLWPPRPPTSNAAPPLHVNRLHSPSHLKGSSVFLNLTCYLSPPLRLPSPGE